MTDREKNRGLGQRVRSHLHQAREVRQRSADAERARGETHVLDRRIGEQPLDIAPPVQHERCKQQADDSQCDHDRANVERRGISGKHHLEGRGRH
jgi:hypothetical protein